MQFSDLRIHVPGKQEKERAVCPNCPPTNKNGTRRTDKDLWVDHDTGYYGCHRCGWEGFLKEKKDTFNYVTPEKATTERGKLYEYFEKRGIGRSVVDEAGLEFISKSNDWIVFNYFFDGKVVNQKFRSLDKKFRQSKGGTQTFYRLDNIIGQEEFIITEGEIDALSFLEADLNATSVPSGGISPTEKVNKKLDFLNNTWNLLNPKKVYLALDNDMKGRGMRDELARRFGKHKCFIINYPDGCKDINDVLVKYGAEKVRDCYKNAIPYPVDGVFRVNDFRDNVIDSIKSGEPEPYHSGKKEIDQYLKNQDKTLVTITGIPGHGKSTFVEGLVLDYAENMGYRYAIFSGEHSKENIVKKLLQKLYRKRPEKLEDKHIQDGMDFLDNHFYFIKPPEDYTIDNIIEKVQYAVYRYGVNGVVLDNWSALEHQKGSESETTYISQILNKIQRFIKANDLTWYLVAHPKKMEGKKKYEKPNLYSISGSAHFFNLTDIGIIIYRDEEDTELIIQKIRERHHGKTGTVLLSYHEAGNFLEPKGGRYEEFSENF